VEGAVEIAAAVDEVEAAWLGGLGHWGLLRAGRI